jgi:glycogen debranching enzyme
MLEFETRLGSFSLVFLDSETLMLTFPPCRCGISFQANLDRAETDRRGGEMHLTGEIRRNIAYTTNAPVLRNLISNGGLESQRVNLIVEGGRSGTDKKAVLLLNITPRLGFNRYIPDPVEAKAAAAERWHAWFAAVPPVLAEYQDQYYFAWWIMRAGLISTRFYTTREAMTPSKLHYVGVWQWDAYFHALAYRYVDMHLAQDQLRILLDHQREDGMIPDAVHDEGTITYLNFPVEADVTKPPLIAWAAWKLYEYGNDREFLDEIYAGICRWNNWWFEKNDLNHNGLCEYQHPFSSGLDDSPLWDGGMPVESPDLNTYLCLQQEAMSKIAAVIGEISEARLWEKRSAAMVKRMLRLSWDPAEGLFWARRRGALVKVVTPFSLFPLVTGRLPVEVAARLVDHLVNPRRFWPQFPVPTVALDDPRYDPNQMWRGPTWINVNYLLIEGLLRSGYAELAHQLRQRTLEMVSRREDIYEYYHPETGENPPKAAPIFGWSSSIFIELAIQATREAS